MPINADSGFHSGFSRLPQEVPLATAKDYENYISRLRQWPRYVHEEIELMRLGVKRGFTVPRATLTGYDRTMSAHVVDRGAEDQGAAPSRRAGARDAFRPPRLPRHGPRLRHGAARRARDEREAVDRGAEEEVVLLCGAGNPAGVPPSSLAGRIAGATPRRGSISVRSSIGDRAFWPEGSTKLPKTPKTSAFRAAPILI
jgi:uncharacterized protein DUF885